MFKDELFKVIKARKSIRAFTDDEISVDALEYIAEAGRSSPSSVNRQVRHFTMVKNRELIAKLARAIGKEIYDPNYNFHGATAIALVSVPNAGDISAIEVGLAVQNMWLAATALDLGMSWTHQINGLSNVPAVRQILNEMQVPKNHICLNVMAIGVPAENPPAKSRNENIHIIQ